MAGRTTSLASVLRAACVNANPLEMNPNKEYRFTWHFDGLPHEIIATISAARSRFYYEDLNDDRLPPRVRAEAEHLRGCHGFIFVIDSQTARWDANLDEFDKLRRDLSVYGRSLDEVPIVFQLNKRDLNDICALEQARDALFTRSCAYVQSVAPQDIGTREAVNALLELMGNPKTT